MRPRGRTWVYKAEAEVGRGALPKWAGPHVHQLDRTRPLI